MLEPLPPPSYLVRKQHDADLRTSMSAAFGELSASSKTIYSRLMRVAVARGHVQGVFCATLAEIGLPADEASREALKPLARELLTTGLEWTSPSMGAGGRTASAWHCASLLASFTIRHESGSWGVEWTYAPSLREVILEIGERMRQDTEGALITDLLEGNSAIAEGGRGPDDAMAPPASQLLCGWHGQGALQR